jgi:hypothetical protein
MPSMVTLNVKLECPPEVQRRVAERVKAALDKLYGNPPIPVRRSAWDHITEDALNDDRASEE